MYCRGCDNDIGHPHLNRVVFAVHSPRWHRSSELGNSLVCRVQVLSRHRPAGHVTENVTARGTSATALSSNRDTSRHTPVRDVPIQQLVQRRRSGRQTLAIVQQPLHGPQHAR